MSIGLSRIAIVVTMCTLVPALCSEALPAALQTPEGHSAVLRFKAKGVQIYKSVPDGNGKFKWEFEAPLANVYDEAGKHMGRHFEGPTWESIDGSKVKKIAQDAVVMEKAPNAGKDIPWLLIHIKEEGGAKQGVLSSAQFVQRIDTEGGVMPTVAPTGTDQRAFVEYSATYVFFN